MIQKSEPDKAPAEQVVKDIRRATRRSSARPSPTAASSTTCGLRNFNQPLNQSLRSREPKTVSVICRRTGFSKPEATARVQRAGTRQRFHGAIAGGRIIKRQISTLGRVPRIQPLKSAVDFLLRLQLICRRCEVSDAPSGITALSRRRGLLHRLTQPRAGTEPALREEHLCVRHRAVWLLRAVNLLLPSSSAKLRSRA